MFSRFGPGSERIPRRLEERLERFKIEQLEAELGLMMGELAEEQSAKV